MAPHSTGSYIAALDGLRALAVFLVVGYHMRGTLEVHAQDALNQGGLWPWFNSGFIGVDLFFVLSGFLITRILLQIVDTPGAMLKFWMRRVLRLMPLHLLYVLTLIVLTLLPAYPWAAPGLSPVSVIEWVMMIFYLGNMVLMFHGPMPLEFVLLWSLAIEEQFYLLWPWMVKKLPLEELWRFMLFGWLFCGVLRAIIYALAPGSGVQFVLFTRMDGLLVGACIAAAQVRWPQRWPSWQRRLGRLWPLALLIIALVLRQSWRPWEAPSWFESVFISVVGLAWAILLLRILEGGALVRALLQGRAVTYVGKISYGIYIWHMIPCTLSVYALKQAGYSGAALQLGALALACLITLVVATLSYYGFERPFLNLKARFAYTA